MKAAIILTILWLAPGLSFSSELPSPEYKQIVDGVWYGEVKVKDPPIIYHVIRVDLSSAEVEVRPLRPRRDETLKELSQRLGASDLPLRGAISGDYFHCLKEYELIVPWGILVRDGRLIFSPTGRSALCRSGQGAFYISVPAMEASLRNRVDSSGIRIAAVNRPVKSGETGCGIYNSTWGIFAPELPEGFAVTVSGESEFRLDRTIRGTVTGISRLPVKTKIPESGFVILMERLPPADQLELKLGSPVAVNIKISSSPEDAIGGGPRIIRGGRISIEMARENFGSGISFYIKNSRHPRSAVGIGPDAKTLFLVVVEGRSDESQGMNMRELSRLLLSLGATEAMSFDGGRSVSMYLNGKEVVRGDRQIADALGVFSINNK